MTSITRSTSASGLGDVATLAAVPAPSLKINHGPTSKEASKTAMLINALYLP